MEAGFHRYLATSPLPTAELIYYSVYRVLTSTTLRLTSAHSCSEPEFSTVQCLPGCVPCTLLLFLSAGGTGTKYYVHT